MSRDGIPTSVFGEFGTVEEALLSEVQEGEPAGYPKAGAVVQAGNKEHFGATAR